jgi:hypothetical protein
VFERHESLNVVATSTVEVQRHTSEEPRLQWGDLTSLDVTDTHCEMLEIGDRVAPPPDLLAAVAELRRTSATPWELAVAVVDLVHAEVKYVFGATGVHTRASEAWEQRSGVCQDMAHLVLGALRSVGIPARYVSGYLMPSRTGELGVPYAGESHAWIQFWDDGWKRPDEQHPPWRPARRGGRRARLSRCGAVDRHLHREPDLGHVRLRGDDPAVLGQSSGAVWMTWKAGSS